MLSKNTLCSVLATFMLVSGSCSAVMAQSDALIVNPVGQEIINDRLRIEGARLYMHTISKLASVIEEKTAIDSDTAIIDALRGTKNPVTGKYSGDGKIENLPGLGSELRQLISAMKIRAKVIDIIQAPDETNEGLIVYVNENDLRGTVTRADLERESLLGKNRIFVRFQDGKVLGYSKDNNIHFNLPSGSFTGAGIGIFFTFNDDNIRVLSCGPGFSGAGITQERNSSGKWVEDSRDCTEVVENSRFCLDPSQTQCQKTDRTVNSEIFIIRGYDEAQAELELSKKHSFDNDDIGTGFGKVPKRLDGMPVSSISFPAESEADFKFIGNCSEELGPGSTGEVIYYRDYSRQEEWFNDNHRNEYRLTYTLFDKVGRGPIPASYGSSVPDGTGWYKHVDSCIPEKAVIIENDSYTEERKEYDSVLCKERSSEYRYGRIDRNRTVTVFVDTSVEPHTETVLNTTEWEDTEGFDNECYSIVEEQKREERTARGEKEAFCSLLVETPKFTYSPDVKITNSITFPRSESRSIPRKDFDGNGGSGDYYYLERENMKGFDVYGFQRKIITHASGHPGYPAAPASPAGKRYVVGQNAYCSNLRCYPKIVPVLIDAPGWPAFPARPARPARLPVVEAVYEDTIGDYLGFYREHPVPGFGKSGIFCDYPQIRTVNKTIRTYPTGKTDVSIYNTQWTQKIKRKKVYSKCTQEFYGSCETWSHTNDDAHAVCIKPSSDFVGCVPDLKNAQCVEFGKRVNSFDCKNVQILNP